MIVASEHQAKLRQKEIQEIDKKASKEHEEAKKNSNFTQTYPRAGSALESFVRDKQGAAAIDQQFLANQMGCFTRTIRRWLDW